MKGRRFSGLRTGGFRGKFAMKAQGGKVERLLKGHPFLRRVLTTEFAYGGIKARPRKGGGEKGGRGGGEMGNGLRRGGEILLFEAVVAPGTRTP